MSRTIAALLAAGTTYSFEFFPPNSEDAEVQLARTLGDLELLQPSFVSITYGAGGSTRHRTRRLVVDILRRTKMTPMAHLTCVGHDRAELVDILERYRRDGVANILALRGDPPTGATSRPSSPEPTSPSPSSSSGPRTTSPSSTTSPRSESTSR